MATLYVENVPDDLYEARPQPAPFHRHRSTGIAIRKSVRVGRCSRLQADELLRTMQMMNLPAIPSAQLVELALSIASFHGRAIYDCLYVALAKQSGAEMVSADEKLVNSLAGHFRLKWLGAFA